MDFAWYSEINHSNEIEQGDLIPDCPIVIPPSKIEEGDEPEIEIKLIDSIILSQSCDLANNKIQIVLVCPYFPLKIFIENLPNLPEKEKGRLKVIKKNVENLKKGFIPGYHLLNKSKESNIEDYIVVDFRNVYGIQIETLRKIAENIESRQRLLPPYREHLSQAFARYFMRVGLPQDILIEDY
jgi:pyoverdine/dityrosine biosynthesis protein Dit1